MYSHNIHTHINSRLFPIGVGRNHRTPPATILTYSFCLIHVHTSGHTSTPVTSTAHPTFLKNLTNKVRVGLSRASPPGVATHICQINPFCKSPFIHPLNMSKDVFTQLLLYYNIIIRYGNIVKCIVCSNKYSPCM